MEPLTIATTFATIVSLMATYKSEAKSTSNDDYQGFLEWLEENKHEEIINLLNSNNKLAVNIKESLNTQNEIFIAQLQRLDQGIGDIAQKLECFSGIAKSINPKSSISKQAYSIIKQLVVHPT